MHPRDKYGDEFLYKPVTMRKGDGSEIDFHEIAVCILPKGDAPTTLTYAWEVLRELALWTCEEFKDRPVDETYRITVAWSKKVRERQGHIVKVWRDLKGLRDVAACATPEECSARFGSGWTPFYHWQKDVFAPKS